jgi:hypothetical protein
MEKRKEFIRRQGRIAARMIKEKQDRIAKKKSSSKFESFNFHEQLI